MKSFYACLIILHSHVLIGQNSSSLLLPALFNDSPLFSNVNVAGESKKNLRIQLLYENRFLVKDLSPKFLCFEKTYNDSRWTLSFSDWGSKYYKERSAQVNYSMKLNPTLRAGVGILIQSISSPKSNQNTFKVYPAFGMQYQLSRNYEIFTSFKLNTGAPFYYSAYLGFSTEIATSYELYFLIKSSAEEKVFGSVGIKYKRDSGNQFFLQLNNNNYPLAIAYKVLWNKFSFRISMYYHLQLGVSNHVGVGYHGSR